MLLYYKRKERKLHDDFRLKQRLQKRLEIHRGLILKQILLFLSL